MKQAKEESPRLACPQCGTTFTHYLRARPVWCSRRCREARPRRCIRCTRPLADRKARTCPHACRAPVRVDLPKDVRRVKGDAYQARPWIGPSPDANVNLGLYRPRDYGGDRDAAISDASRASIAFKKAMAEAGGPHDIWTVIQRLQGQTRFGRPVVRSNILPPLVMRPSRSKRYGVRGRPELSFATVDEAWTVARAMYMGRRYRLGTGDTAASCRRKN